MLYGYARVSTSEQATGTSLDEQHRRILGAALMNGAELSGLFTDAGVSGSMPLRHRHEGRRMLDTVRTGDVIIAAKLDRLFRSASDALATVDRFRAEGVALVIADMGADPVTDAGTSRLFFGMLALVAEFELSRIRERQADGIRAKRSKGGYTGGRCPFGYRIEGQGQEARLIPVPEEQDAIDYMHSLRAEGLGYEAIAKACAAVGVPISHMTAKRVLARTEART